jgi:hypothetical protein
MAFNREAIIIISVVRYLVFSFMPWKDVRSDRQLATAISCPGNLGFDDIESLGVGRNRINGQPNLDAYPSLLAAPRLPQIRVRRRASEKSD